MGPQSPAGAGFVVVGVDGSASSLAAVRWAVTHARLIGARLEAVTAWQEPSTYGLAYDFSPARRDATEISTLAAKGLTETVARVIASVPDPPVVTTRVVQGHPAQVLSDAARGARVLVLGRRGHGALANMLLGSVSHHCVQHAPCPVVVVGNVGDTEQE